VEAINPPKLNALLDYPPEPFLKRRWVNYRINQTLPITLFNDPEDYDKLATEFGKAADYKFIFKS